MMTSTTCDQRPTNVYDYVKLETTTHQRQRQQTPSCDANGGNEPDGDGYLKVGAPVGTGASAKKIVDDGYMIPVVYDELNVDDVGRWSHDVGSQPLDDVYLQTSYDDENLYEDI